MSWMVTATSWAPPRLPPDMWVIWGLRGLVGRLWLVFPRRVHSLGVFVHRALAFPLELASPPHPSSHPYEPQASSLAPASPAPWTPLLLCSNLFTPGKHPHLLSQPLRTCFL